MQNIKNPNLDRYDELIEIAKEIQKTYKEESQTYTVAGVPGLIEPSIQHGSTLKTVDREMYGEWINNGLALILSTFDKNHPHYASFNKYHNRFHNSHDPSHKDFIQSLGVLKSARKVYEFDLKHGDHETPETSNRVLFSKVFIDKRLLKDFMVESFNLVELRNFCGDIGVNHENLTYANKTEFVQAVIEHFDSNRTILNLIAEVAEVKPMLPLLSMFRDR